MRRILLLLTAMLVACATVPSSQSLAGGHRVEQPGVSFVLPEGQRWATIMCSTYQCVFGVEDAANDETLIVAQSVFNIKPDSSREEFLKAVRDGRAQEPDTGRFEVIRNTEQLYDGRSETCVLYRAASKDFGAKARRGGQHTVLESIGMTCVHPGKSSVGVQVELSRKAPPDSSRPGFDAEGLALLQSVRFGPF